VEKIDMQKKILEEDDFIHAPKYQNSLNKLLAKTDKLLENGAIGRLLLLSEKEVEEIYQQSILELKKEMNPDDDEDRGIY
jgi:transcriptional regulator of nitric oxide reductase